MQYDSDEQETVFLRRGPAVPPVSVPGYKILEPVGKGTTGVIYRAIQLSLDRAVALKVLAPKVAAHAKVKERFLQEARLAAKLNHPSIIQVYDVAEKDGVTYIAMEYVDGPSVGEILRRGGAMDEKRAVRVAAEVAGALEFAYARGIIHRDVKPDNILLNSEGRVRLADLGLAAARPPGSPSVTGGRGILGTPHYISPEAAKGGPVDTRSDLYSLGATLYHMLVGEPPYPGTSAVQVIARHLTEALVPPRQRNAAVSAAAEEVVAKLMQKDPASRYPDPGAARVALEALLRTPTPAAAAAPAKRPVRRFRRSVMRRLRNR